MAGKFGKFSLKALCVSCAFIVRVTEAPADHKTTNGEEFRGRSCGDKPVFIEEIDNYSKILKTGRLSNFVLFLYLTI